MNVKTGTQTWSNSPQRTDFKSDGVQNMSATDQDKFYSGQDIGEILNKTADPNYVDPAKKMRTVGDNQLNKDAFMNLLLTQMKNQDPTNPLKSHEMAAQLAQFTSLEKLTNIDQSIAGLRKDQEPSHNFDALALIGKTLNTDNSKILRIDAKGNHDIRFDLGNDAQTTEVKIKDANGNIVRTLQYPGLKKGPNEINWNGQMDDGSEAPVGEYTADVGAVASNGKKIYAETKVQGTITGVNFTPKGPQLLIGKKIINMSDVKSISDPNISNQEPAVAQTQPAQTVQKKGAAKAEDKPDAAKKARLSQGDISQLAMTQDFINTLNKTGAKAGGMQGGG